MFETVTLAQILMVTSTAFFTSAITALIGAGGGTILLLVMLYSLPALSVIPLHGTIQLVSNTTRVTLLWRHMHWPIIFRFISLMPIGVYLGLQLYNVLAPEGIKLIIASAILISLFAKLPAALRDRQLPIFSYYIIGIVIGFGNMIVGVLAPLLAAFLRHEPLTKEQMVGTLGFFGFAGNLLKIASFSAVGFAFADYLPLIIPACLASIIGSYCGKVLLTRSSNQFFIRAFQIMIALLATKMIFDVMIAWL